MTSYDRYQQQLYENWLVEIILDIINFLLQLSPSVLAGPSAPNNPPPAPSLPTHTHLIFLSQNKSQGNLCIRYYRKLHYICSF